MWERHFWEEWEHLLGFLTKLNVFVHSIEADNVSAGAALEQFVHVKSEVLQFAQGLPAKIQSKLVEIIQRREAMFATPWAMLSNLLDPRFRCKAFPAPKRREAIQFLCQKAWKVFHPTEEVVSMAHLDEWLEMSGSFNDALNFMGGGPMDGHKAQCFWPFYKDSPLHLIGMCCVALPASTASVEKRR